MRLDIKSLRWILGANAGDITRRGGESQQLIMNHTRSGRRTIANASLPCSRKRWTVDNHS